MKTCDYCGKENEEISTHCAGCGTVLEVPAQVSKRPKLPRTLDAKNATIIFLAFVVAAVIPAMITLAVAGVGGVPQYNQLTIAEEFGVPLGQVFAGVVMI